ncbi:Heterokaryon incompatibility protein [Diaporthe amygdali]|uniref:Heterokaryon incompatibility protein n=1 Tax=Phomopsis amygdali TaxID=1214568 RepID=UPI0022FE2E27|nr:Heterokaryon incompatibility protein [Diaporthe amygdali]KAJ0116230.1 Heterokaryon incompatibility protein [Diaporthe amygdali]
MFQSRIPVSDLSLNFRDAIYATRKLGFRYIWIDSLCIIQGSDGDWEQEALAMNMVYKHAVFTLAAAASADSYGELFRKRVPEVTLPYKLEVDQPYTSSDQKASRRWPKFIHRLRKSYSSPTSGLSPSLVPTDLPHPTIHLPVGASQAVAASASGSSKLPHWQVHGWESEEVYEAEKSKALEHLERLIEITAAQRPEFPRGLRRQAVVPREAVTSPKAFYAAPFYFSGDQIFWECRELDGSEIFPRGLPAREQGYTRTGYKTLDPKTMFLLHNVGGFRESDPYEQWESLVAEYTRCSLSNPRDKLVAISGLAREFARTFEDDLVAGLWRTKLISELAWYRDNTQLGSRPQGYRAPTWSWASIDGGVFFLPQSQLDVDYVQILEIDCQYVDDNTMGRIRHAHIRVRGYLFQISLQKRPDDKFATVLHLDTLADLTRSEYFFLPLIVDKLNGLSGLLLEPISEGPGGIYQRIGMLQIRDGYVISELAYRKVIRRKTVDKQAGPKGDCEAETTKSQDMKANGI